MICVSFFAGAVETASGSIENHLEAGGIGEGGAVGVLGLRRRGAVGDQPIEREPAAFDQSRDGREVVGAELGRDPDPGLPHEGRREGEGQRRLVEAGEHDLAAGCEVGDQPVEAGGVTADIGDHRIVAPGILVRRQNRVAGGTVPPGRIRLPDRRVCADGDGEASQQTPEHAVPHDQRRGTGGDAAERPVSRGGECDQAGAVTQCRIHRHEAGGGGHEMGGGAAEQAADGAEAAGAGNEDGLADPDRRVGGGFDHRADRLVARNQRVAHAGERRHAARPEKSLGPGADAAPADRDDRVRRSGRCQGQAGDRQALRTFEDDGESVHDWNIPPAVCATLACAEPLCVILDRHIAASSHSYSNARLSARRSVG
jgi:hypothetical protein